MRVRPLQVGAALLAPGAIVFSIRALVVLAGRSTDHVALAAVTGAAGALSLVGLVLVLVGLRAPAVAGAACILIGHFAVADAVPDLGAGLVYLGTGLLVAVRVPQAATAGAVAMVGALVRSGTPLGHAAVAVGAAWLAVELVRVARDMDIPE